MVDAALAQIRFQEKATELINPLCGFDLQFKVTPPEEYLVNPIHSHECFELNFYLQSNNKAFVNDISYDLNTNDLIVIPPRQIHTIQRTPGYIYSRYVLYFSQEFIGNTLRELGCGAALDFFSEIPCKKILLSPVLVKRISDLFHALHVHQQRPPSDPGAAVCKGYLATIISEVYLAARNQKPLPLESDAPIMEQVIKYINDHYSEEISLELLEKLFFASKYHICRLFRQSMGTSFIEYLQYKRIMEAQRLLSDTELPIIDIGMECGFNNTQHFYRVFKKFVSCTPMRYRSRKPKSTQNS